VQLVPAVKGATLTGDGKDIDALATLRNVLKRDRIRDAARKAFFRGLNQNKTAITFYLNKQVAFAGHVSFSEAEGESPLGPIKVTVQADDPIALIDLLAPRTEKS
jgi:predicted RNA binding protein with dsRBD fold (UPF0201 family)